MLKDDGKKPSRQELEAMRKKIDPTILERVAKSMGGGGGGADAPPSRPAPSRSGSAGPSRSQLAELKRRTQRREKDFSSEDGAIGIKKKSEAWFLVFDQQTLRAKTIQAYLTKVGFKESAIVNNAHNLFHQLLKSLTDPNKLRTVIAVSLPMYQELHKLFTSDETKALRKEMPGLDELQHFIFVEPNTPPIPPGLLDPKLVVRLDHNEAFSGKRMRAVLGIKPPPPQHEGKVDQE